MAITKYEVIANPIHDVQLTTTGLRLGRELSFEEWESMGPAIGKGQRGYALAAGDWLAYGENNFPDKYSQAMDTTGLSLGRLRNLKSICARVPIDVRVPGLSISHYESVASFPVEYQAKFLEMANQYDIDRDTFRTMMANVKNGRPIESNGQVVITVRKVSPDHVVEEARHVVAAWKKRNQSLPVDMTLHQALEDLVETLGVYDE